MMPRGSPRVRGVREHLKRAEFFFGLMKKEADHAAAHRYGLAAVYSCRAITELMLEVKGLNHADPKKDREAFESEISGKLPFYYLIERIRIHDFHRFGIVPPDPKSKQVMFGGPAKLTAQKGAAALSLTPQGPLFTKTGGSQVHLQRPLTIQDGTFFDEDSGQYVKLEDVLDAFLAGAPDVIADFEKRVT